jgi:DNA-directed RNA polymerase specialized sigma24 family protein
MAIEMLNYSQLGERLSCSPEAARSLVKRLRLHVRRRTMAKCSYPSI